MLNDLTKKMKDFDMEAMMAIMQETNINTKLSLVPLIKHWEEKLDTSPDDPVYAPARQILENIKSIPELNAPIENSEVLDKYHMHFKFLVSALMPSGLDKGEMMYVSAPFSMETYFMSEALRKVFERSTIEFSGATMSPCGKLHFMMMKACSLILEKQWGYNMNLNLPMTFILNDPVKEVKEYYKSLINMEYVEITNEGNVPKPTYDEVQNLLNNPEDAELWRRIIQPEKFAIHGIVRAQMVDVTEEEALSRMKYNLLERNALVDRDSVTELETYIRQYYRKKNIKLGISTLDFPRQFNLSNNSGIDHHLLSKSIDHLLDEKYEGSIVEQVCIKREPVVYWDLDKVDSNTGIEKAYKELGFKSVVLLPLIKENKVIGLLELGSADVCGFTSLDLIKLNDVQILFTTAMERSREDLYTQIDSVIREQYTSIHPSIEWKFTETAQKYLKKKEEDPIGAKPDPIVFKDIIPLYGQADIAGSSVTRNTAIQKDLLDNLDLVDVVLEKAQQYVSMPIVGLYRAKVKALSVRIEQKINSNDEIEIVEFLKGQIRPLFKMLAQEHPEMKSEIKEFKTNLDPDLKIVYNRRKDFEDSVMLINDTISSFLEVKENEIQKTLPHFFEKYKTDGVEFDLYLGQSLLKEKAFSPMHLKNMRLWQIIIMTEIGRLVDGLKAKLPVRLNTAQLILIHSNPISIRFRMDEKRFDVDGAYNVRYEILKKRIDKALIKGTNNRLTQPGTVSIIYSQEKDLLEYNEYVEFVKDLRLIKDEVEYFDLQPTQGVDGLKAIRLTIEMDADAHSSEDLEGIISSAVLQ